MRPGRREVSHAGRFRAGAAMRITIRIVVIAGVIIGLIVALLAFGFSDFLGRPYNQEIWDAKPWRPWARLAFAFVCISGVGILGGALIRVSFRGT